MNRTILIQQIYPDTLGVEVLELVRPHHAEYCFNLDFDYRCEIANPLPDCDPKLGSWGKIELIRQAMITGYEFIIWLDADTLIKDFDVDLRHAIEPGKIGACWHRIPQLNHWNVGALYISNSAETKKFIDDWLACYPPADGWMEQGAFNKLAFESDVVVTLSDKWNATIDVSMVPDAVVLGFHGQGNTEFRINMMRKALEKLFPVEKA